MKKRISIALACTILIGAGVVSVVALNKTGNGTWTFVSKDYFGQFQTKTGIPILVEHLQDHDYSEIDNQ